jgi:hypothetical protein
MKSEHLSKKIPLDQMVRQMLARKNLREAGQWIRDFCLQGNSTFLQW